ncbi:hypothetical protein ACVW16_005375 [Bradyrhizobium sp. USDA 4474]
MQEGIVLMAWPVGAKGGLEIFVETYDKWLELALCSTAKHGQAA